MRLSHSISMTLLATALTALTGCGDDSADDGGSGGAATGGSATGGTATGGTATGGSGGMATGGSGGSATGGGAGSSAGGSGGGGVLDHPTDQTQAGIEAFLMMESYKTTGMGWRPEATPGDDAATPHLATNRFFNDTIIASKAAGNRPPTMGQHTAGSMSVKELLDGTTVIGKAATLRSDANTWIFYCKASVADRCGTSTVADTAVFTTSPNTNCACHGGGANNSHTAIPAP
jgi:hypothetical protein